MGSGGTEVVEIIEAAGKTGGLMQLPIEPAKSMKRPALSAAEKARVTALNTLGISLLGQERFSESEQAFASALLIDPRCGPVWNNLGNLYRVQAKADEAAAAYRRAIDCDPKQAAAFTNLGNVLRDLGKLPEAMAALRRAVELNPGSPAIHSNLAYAACFDPACDARAILDHAAAWAQRFETPLLATHRPHGNIPDPDRRLRIGYVSADFRDHVVGRNVLPILEAHPRDAFEVHCFSSTMPHDDQTAAFTVCVDGWHECAAMDDAQLAEAIRAEQIDILVDLSLHLAGNRLAVFARKPAPVQITWAGYPGTTGLQSIDWRITDPQLDPVEGNNAGGTGLFYSEKSIRLPSSFWCYRPMTGTPEVNALPAVDGGFITFGCLNNPAKVSERALELWSKVLAAVSGSRLLMLAPEGSRRREVTDFFSRAGIEASRIGFVGPTKPSEHMRRYHRVDICLDPLPYTGHTTTLDGLWMGVPVITLPGVTSLSRGSITGLVHVGLADLVADSPEEYVAIASRLAGDLPRLSQLRNSLRDRMKASTLCDEQRFTADLEAVYRQVWKEWIKNRKEDCHR
jgi:predicted O-linked N-acetylglucosamine transferase (SPINDLY family)